MTEHNKVVARDDLKGWVWLLLGLLAGAVGSAILMQVVVFPLRLAAQREAPTWSEPAPVMERGLQTRAYRDQSPCVKSTLQMHVGTWEGSSQLASGETSRWRNVRRADGRFEISFLLEDGTVQSQERGYWAITGCIYASLITEVDSEPALFQEVYRVHEISGEHLVYSNYRTGNVFEQRRVSSIDE
jgi:hypothetical protein